MLTSLLTTVQRSGAGGGSGSSSSAASSTACVRTALRKWQQNISIRSDSVSAVSAPSCSLSGASEALPLKHQEILVLSGVQMERDSMLDLMAVPTGAPLLGHALNLSPHKLYLSQILSPSFTNLNRSNSYKHMYYLLSQIPFPFSQECRDMYSKPIGEGRLKESENVEKKTGKQHDKS